MKQIKIGVIYKYTSPSGKIYIGQTINERSRKSKHKNDTSKTNTYFGKAIRKYGWENFKYEVIIKFNPTADREKLKRVLDKLEKRYINLFKSNDPNSGYNLNEGGNGNLGYTHSEETKKVISESSKSYWEDPEFREKMKIAFDNRDIEPIIRSEEFKQNLSNKCTTKKQVCQFDLHGKLLNTYDSINDAAKSLTSTHTLKTLNNRISECCSGKRVVAYDYMWSFK